MKTRTLIYSVMLSMAAGVLGYFLRGRPQDSAVLLPSEVPILRAYVARQSFSEIRNAKATLEELGARYVMAVRVRRQMDLAQSAGGRASTSYFEPHLAGAIEELEQGMQDFRGTGQEFIVAQDLLMALKKSRRYHRWLEVYLDVLYQHPTQPLIGRFASEAIIAARAIGREEAPVAGFKHLMDIPLDFDGKRQVQRVLVSVQRQYIEPAKARHGENQRDAQE